LAKIEKNAIKGKITVYNGGWMSYTLHMIKKGNIMKKTITTNTFAGPLATTFELVRHETFSTIRKVEQNGKSLKNKWGGFPSVHTGQHGYINRLWKEL
tara:strand:- start:2084 stop:2377 length:294 start_codon:yes stop_codon:yes gene_type:complete